MTSRIACLGVALICFFNGFGQPGWKVERSELMLHQAPFQSCHASTLVETGTGELLFSCFGGTGEGKPDVAIWTWRQMKKGYTAPEKVADGKVNDSLRFPTWNPVLFRDQSGMIYLFYKVGPNPREWWGYGLQSANGGKAWSRPIRLPEGVLGPIKNKPVQLENGVILSPSSTESKDDRWRIHLEISKDTCRTWTILPIDPQSSFDVIQPSILKHKDGTLQLLCRSKQGAVVQSWSNDNGVTWSPLEKSNLLNPNSGTDAITLLDGRQLIVYNPDIPGKEWWEGRTKLRVAVAVDGRNWNDVAVLEDQATGEFSYPSVIQTRDGKVHITYTYNRSNIRHVVLVAHNTSPLR
ncbi:sialidase family protein [Flavihumibacter petaseus]|uniref:Sialidase domain-containing protein n=1 Tax=Flavihumibacter petaseus NBRC 106054 TaxID=1220578 RepID=A0A0E9MYJ0_9BACT|nr:sialidase family protein [Flavihumibacter petaseus]GAO42659.1 hypothetical protein FPE01S_01_16740 [Flavihumibacter petaseus NBRC 106054]